MSKKSNDLLDMVLLGILLVLGITQIGVGLVTDDVLVFTLGCITVILYSEFEYLFKQE